MEKKNKERKTIINFDVFIIHLIIFVIYIFMLIEI